MTSPQRTRPLLVRMAALSLLCMSLALPAAATAEPEALLDELQRQQGLSLVWDAVNARFPFRERLTSFRERVAQARIEAQAAATTPTYYAMLEQLVASLNDGHTFVLAPRGMAYQRSKPSVGVQLVGGVPVVSWVRNDLAAQVPLGSVVHRVNGVDVFEVARQRTLRVSASTAHKRLDIAMSRVLEGERGSMAKVDYVTPSGERRTRDFERGDVRPEGTRLLFLQNLETTRTAFDRFDDGQIAYFAARDFRDDDVHAAFVAHLAELQASRVVVIDVRANSGGQSTVGYALLAHFLAQPVVEGGSRAVTTSAGHAELTELTPDVIEPAPMSQRITARLVVLTDGETVSAAEDFISLASTVGAVRVGTTTAGSTGEMTRTTLPGGGTLFVLSKWDRSASGEEFVGLGFAPHERVEPRVAELLAGRDPILERGLTVARRLALD